MATRVSKAPELTMTPELYEKHKPVIAATLQALESAQGVHRNALKAAQEDGLDTKALLQVMRWSRKPREGLHSFLQNVARFNAWEDNILALPKGFQADMFGRATPAGGMEKTKAAGFKVGKAGTPASANPHPDGSAESMAWLQGHSDGFASRVQDAGEKDLAKAKVDSAKVVPIGGKAKAAAAKTSAKSGGRRGAGGLPESTEASLGPAKGAAPALN